MLARWFAVMDAVVACEVRGEEREGKEGIVSLYRVLGIGISNHACKAASCGSCSPNLRASVLGNQGNLTFLLD